MSDPKTEAVPSPPVSAWALAKAELPEVTYLRRALELVEEDGLGFGRADVRRVEATWSMDDGDSNAHGFVLSLRDGRRIYLGYCFDFAENAEEIETQPMGDERYPAIEGGGIVWSDDVGEVNRLLMS